MNDQATEEATTEDLHAHCGPGGGMHRKMWMYSQMAGRGRGRGPFGRGPFGGGRGSRAQRWMYENPSDDQIIEFLEEYQRDLEQKVEDVRTRIEDIKGRKSDS